MCHLNPFFLLKKNFRDKTDHRRHSRSILDWLGETTYPTPGCLYRKDYTLNFKIKMMWRGGGLACLSVGTGAAVPMARHSRLAKGGSGGYSVAKAAAAAAVRHLAVGDSAELQKQYVRRSSAPRKPSQTSSKHTIQLNTACTDTISAVYAHCCNQVQRRRCETVCGHNFGPQQYVKRNAAAAARRRGGDGARRGGGEVRGVACILSTNGLSHGSFEHRTALG